MHKGVILLVKAKNKETAKEKAEEFLQPYYEHVWDWYQIGGRWTGTLSNYDPEKDPQNITVCDLCNGTGLRNDELGKQARAENPDYTCNGCSGKGEHVKWPTQWAEHDGDILPLADCLDVVNDWKQDHKKESEKALAEVAKFDSDMMKGFCMERAGKFLGQQFSMDTNVFNVYEGNYSIPQGGEVKKYYAVMVDMHN